MFRSIQSFKFMVNLRYFHHHEIILYLNNYNSFINKLSQGFSLSLCFNSNSNPSYVGPQWDGNDTSINFNPNYVYNSTIDRDTHLDDCRNAAIQFIQERYRECCPPHKGVYMHPLDISNDNDVQKVWWDTKNIIVRRNLARSGIMI